MSLAGKKILITPLNWGIGHASRCVPLVHALIDAGAEVILGSDGSAAAFLEKEIPEVPVIEMEGDDIRYGKKGVMGALLPQLPKFFKQIKKDRDFIKTLLKVNPVDLIISDNRYGCYHPEIPSVLITHQLNIQAPIMAKSFIDQTLKKWVNNFSEVWIPDIENGLAGTLTEGKFNTPIKFLGPLSRIGKQAVKESIPLLILLSGPEPQRSILEAKIWKQIQGLETEVVLVRGTLDKKSFVGSSTIKVYDLLDSKALGPLLNAAERVICRSGYSSLMDLAQLGKPALLIATPGQYEQMYLSKYYKKKEYALVQEQHTLNIQSFLKATTLPKIPLTKMNMDQWIKSVTNLLSIK